MKKKTEDDQKNSGKDHESHNSCKHKDCLCGSNKCRFRCALCVIALLVICVIGEHVYRSTTNVPSVPLVNVAPDSSTQASTSASQTQSAPGTESDVAPAPGATSDPITQADSTATPQHISEDSETLEPVEQPPASEAKDETSATTLGEILQTPDEREILEQKLQTAGTANIDELKKTVSILEEEVKRLAVFEKELKKLSPLVEEVKKLPELKEEVSKLSDRIGNSYVKAVDARDQWKIWINLKDKMEKDEDFSDELERFRSAFAGDKELTALVEDLVSGATVGANKEEKGIIGTCKKFIRKIIKVKKINQAKLSDILGYVLSSMKK
ncbi:hypothetical protein FACS189449_04660 [Alphaproteobacteria bacterium]|nr:hypothetical protein FACS189449_04660 [Alphaproteobacteria bacterium]